MFSNTDQHSTCSGTKSRVLRISLILLLTPFVTNLELTLGAICFLLRTSTVPAVFSYSIK
jgi:hypothetical protein